MSTAKFVLYGALGAAAVLLLTSERARSIRTDMEDKAMKNANKWKGKLHNMGNSAKASLSELRELLNTEMEGLSDDAKDRIETILNKTASSANGLKRNIRNQMG